MEIDMKLHESHEYLLEHMSELIALEVIKINLRLIRDKQFAVERNKLISNSYAEFIYKDGYGVSFLAGLGYERTMVIKDIKGPEEYNLNSEEQKEAFLWLKLNGLTHLLYNLEIGIDAYDYYRGVAKGQEEA